MIFSCKIWAHWSRTNFISSLPSIPELPHRTPQGSLSESERLSVMSDSLWPHGLYSSWNSPGQNTGVGSLSLLQQIFLTQESNHGLLHCRRPQFKSWVRKICWRRERLPTLLFWPRKFHGLYSQWGHKGLDITDWLSLHCWWHSRKTQIYLSSTNNAKNVYHFQTNLAAYIC